jgi:4-amino-4-deoxy-L-arabinose transferase-like glycosyltransferase
MANSFVQMRHSFGARGWPTRAAWLCLLGVAAGLRLWGLDWGRPVWNIYPDEDLILGVVQHLSWTDLDPKFYSYSGLTFYLSFFSAEVLKALNLTLSDFDRILLHRAWSVLFGTLGVVVAYRLVRALGYNRRAGLLAAAAMAFAPLHVWDSHLGTTDVSLTFWCGLALVVSLWAYRRPHPVRWLLGGVAVGLAVGVKFNGAFTGLPFVVALALAVDEGRVDRREAWRFLSALAGGALAGSFVTTPFTFINLAGAVKAFLFEYHHVHEGHIGFDLNAPGWQYHRYIYYLGAGLPFSLGIALYALALAGLVGLATRWRSRRVAIAASFAALYFLVIGSWTYVPIRYALPLFPFLMAAAGIAAERAIARWRWQAAIPLVCVAIYTGVFTLTTTARFAEDTRDQAAVWIRRNVPPRSTVFLVHVRELTHLPLVDARRYQRKRLWARYLPAAVTRRAQLGQPAWAVLSSLDYQRDYRRGRGWEWELVRRHSGYRLVYRARAWFLNRAFYERLDPLFGGYWISPDIEVYEVTRPSRAYSR